MKLSTMERLFSTIRDQYETHPARAMAISPQFGVFIFDLLKSVESRYDGIKVLDAGSGFSSFICRLFPENKTITIDTDQEWLNVTANKLVSHSLSVDNMLLADAYLINPHLHNVDLAIYDLGNYDQRIEYFDKIMNMVRPGGMVLFDDMQNSDVKYQVMSLVKSKWVIEEFLNKTDEFGRWFAVGRKPE